MPTSEASRTRELVEEIASSSVAAALRVQIADRFRHLGVSDEQIEDAFQTACERGVAGKCSATTRGEAYAWLRTTTGNAVIDEVRRRRRELLVDWDEERLEAGYSDSCEGADREVIRHEDHRELASLARRVVEQLDERKRRVLALHSVGCKRPEIASQLGAKNRAIKRPGAHRPRPAAHGADALQAAVCATSVYARACRPSTSRASSTRCRPTVRS